MGVTSIHREMIGQQEQELDQIHTTVGTLKVNYFNPYVSEIANIDFIYWFSTYIILSLGDVNKAR